MATPQRHAKIIGDHTMNDFLKDVKVTEILGMSYTFSFASTMTSLTMEVDPHGSETILIIGCLSSIYDRLVANEREMSTCFDKLRLLFDAYLIRTHEIYLCQPLGCSSGRITGQSQLVYNEVRVSSVNAKLCF